jgi:hypothetical protein
MNNRHACQKLFATDTLAVITGDDGPKNNTAAIMLPVPLLIYFHLLTRMGEGGS